MKNVNKILLVLASSALLLGGCGPTAGSDSNSSGSAESGLSDGSSSAGGNSSASSGSSEAEQYQIVVAASAGLSVTPDKTKAAAGETVNLTIVVTSGYTLLSLKANNEILTVADGKASFTMPEEDVKISASLSVAGDLTIAGDFAAVMAKEGDLYVARGVSVASTSAIYVKVSGSASSYTPLGYNQLNRYKCFANVTFSSSHSFNNTAMDEGAQIPTGEEKDSLIELGGNAVYDIYYDPSNSANPLYVQRVGVINIPTSASQYEDLFASDVLSDAATYPANLQGVTYSDSRAGVTYSYQKYAANTSLATITDNDDASVKTYVYKKLSDNILTVVDNYVEGTQVTSPYSYSGGSRTDYLDDTKSEDTAAYSGVYQVTSNVTSHRYQLTEEDAVFEANSYSHDIEAIDRMQWNGYRDSFTIEDDLTFANVALSSVKNADGGFTVTINSYKTYNPTTASSTYATMTAQTHIEYKIVTTFDKAGAPLSGSFMERYYDNTLFNFSTNKFLSGEEAGTMPTSGTKVKAVNYSYAYGADADLQAAPSFDTTPYFASSVTAALKDKTSVVPSDWRLDTQTGDKAIVIEVSPVTALDQWEYGVTATSNSEAIYYSDSYLTYMAEPSGNGKSSDLTISNHVDSKVTAKLTLTVEAATFHSLYLISLSSDDTQLDSSTSCHLYAGKTYTCGLETTPKTNGPLDGITFAYDVEGLLTCSVDAAKRTLTIDASKAVVTASSTVKVTLNSPHYESGWDAASITVTVYPYTASTITETSILGDWAIEAESVTEGDDTKLTFTSNATTNAANVGCKTGTLYIDETTFSFDYLLNTDQDTLTIKTVEAVGTVASGYEADDYQIKVLVEGSTSKIGLCFYGETQDWTNYEMTYTQFLGTLSEDDGLVEPSAYVFFEHN